MLIYFEFRVRSFTCNFYIDNPLKFNHGSNWRICPMLHCISSPPWKTRYWLLLWLWVVTVGVGVLEKQIKGHLRPYKSSISRPADIAILALFASYLPILLFLFVFKFWTILPNPKSNPKEYGLILIWISAMHISSKLQIHQPPWDCPNKNFSGMVDWVKDTQNGWVNEIRGGVILYSSNYFLYFKCMVPLLLSRGSILHMECKC